MDRPRPEKHAGKASQTSGEGTPGQATPGQTTPGQTTPGQTTPGQTTPGQTTPVRVDKWLWAARFFKTRSLAAQAVDGGKIQVNGDRVKPAKTVRPGDEVRLRLGPYEHIIEVRATAERRGPASVAALLYAETEASRLAREKLHWQLTSAAPAMDPEKGRPTKRDRRILEKFRKR